MLEIFQWERQRLIIIKTNYLKDYFVEIPYKRVCARDIRDFCDRALLYHTKI